MVIELQRKEARRLLFERARGGRSQVEGGRSGGRGGVGEWVGGSRDQRGGGLTTWPPWIMGRKGKQCRRSPCNIGRINLFNPLPNYLYCLVFFSGFFFLIIIVYCRLFVVSNGCWGCCCCCSPLSSVSRKRKHESIVKIGSDWSGPGRDVTGVPGPACHAANQLICKSGNYTSEGMYANGLLAATASIWIG